MEEVQTNKNSSSKYDIKIVLVVVSALIFLYSLSREFVTITYMDKTASLYMFEIKGVMFSIVMMMFYIYSLFSNKKAVYIISIILLILSFAYTFYICFNVNILFQDLGNFTRDHIHYGEGILFYIISFAVLLVDFIVPGKRSKLKKEEKISQENLEKSLGLEGKYIFATYIFGMQKRPDLFEKLTALTFNEENNSLEILIQGEKIEKIIILYENLITITCKADVIMSDKPKEIRSTTADRLLIQAMIGPNASLLVSDELLEKLFTYDKMEYKKIFDIEVMYKENGEEHKLRLRTKESPKIFLRNFKDKFIE